MFRRPDLTYYDLDRFAPFTVSGAGGALPAFDGYLSQRPMDRGQSYTFAPEAVGWSAHMKDDASFSMVYIDRQLSTWQGPGTQRQINLLNANTANLDTYSEQVSTDQGGNPAIIFQATGPFPTTSISVGEVWYDAGSNNLISIIQTSRATSAGLTFPSGDAANSIAFFASVDDVASTTTSGSITVSGAFTTSGLTPARFGIIHVQRSTAGGGTTGDTFSWMLENVAIIGNHGLTLQKGPSGLSPGVDDGFFGADIVRDIITRAAPLLGTSGIVEDSFVVPQMVFNAPTDADTAVQAVNQYYQNDYGVYENREFFWRPPATGTQWHVRLGDGATLQDQGPQVETAINGVVVQYTDAAGTSRFAGPPSYGGDFTSSALQDLSSTNPANAYGRKRWALLQMQGLSTSAAAIDAGVNFLQANLARTTAGSITVVGFAKDSNGREWPAWRIRSGDTVIVDDSSDTSSHYSLGTSWPRMTV